MTAEGDEISVGVIGGGGGHAPVSASVDQAAAYYADTDKQLMVGRIHEDDHGVFFLGTVLPEVRQAGIDKINRSALSGDWRWTPRAKGYDCIGPWLVTRPGFPLDRRGFSDTSRAGFVRVASAAGSDTVLDHPVYLSSMGGTMTTNNPPRFLRHRGSIYELSKPAKRAAADPFDVVDGPPEEEDSGGDESSRLDAIESRLTTLEDEMAAMAGREEESAEIIPMEALPVL